MKAFADMALWNTKRQTQKICRKLVKIHSFLYIKKEISKQTFFLSVKVKKH